MANVDMGAAKRIIYMLTNFYPERMVRCWVGWCCHLCFGSVVAGALVLGAVLDNVCCSWVLYLTMPTMDSMSVML